jgi:Flp pilus assembly protein TadG
MRLFRPHDRHRGQGIVEFALVLPVFLLLTLGTIELGWLVYSNHTLTSATREGARYAMVNGERSGDVADAVAVNEVIVERAGRLGDNVNSTFISFSPDAEPGSEVTVRATYDYQPIVGMMVGVSPMTLTSESTVIVQY